MNVKAKGPLLSAILFLFLIVFAGLLSGCGSGGSGGGGAEEGNWDQMTWDKSKWN